MSVCLSLSSTQHRHSWMTTDFQRLLLMLSVLLWVAQWLFPSPPPLCQHYSCCCYYCFPGAVSAALVVVVVGIKLVINIIIFSSLSTHNSHSSLQCSQECLHSVDVLYFPWTVDAGNNWSVISPSHDPSWTHNIHTEWHPLRTVHIIVMRIKAVAVAVVVVCCWDYYYYYVGGGGEQDEVRRSAVCVSDYYYCLFLVLNQRCGWHDDVD